MQQAVFEARLGDLQPVRQDKAAHKAARRNAAMQEGLFALAGVVALAGDGQLAALQGDGQFLGAKPATARLMRTAASPTCSTL